MSSAASAEQRSPDAAATSPGYQGSDGASSTQQTAERPASAEKKVQVAPASEPATVKEDPEPSVATAASAAEPASDADAGRAAKPSEGDATPVKEVCVLCCCKIHKEEKFGLFLRVTHPNIGDLECPIVFWSAFRHAYTRPSTRNAGYLRKTVAFSP